MVAQHLHSHRALLLLASTCASAREGVTHHLLSHVPIEGVPPERLWSIMAFTRLSPRSGLAETLWVLEKCRRERYIPITYIELPQPADRIAQWGECICRPLARQLCYRLPVLRMLKAGAFSSSGTWCIEVKGDEVSQVAGYLRWLIHHTHVDYRLVRRFVCAATSLPWALMLVALGNPELLENYLLSSIMRMPFQTARLYAAVFATENHALLDVLTRTLPVAQVHAFGVARLLEPRMLFHDPDFALIVAVGTRGWRKPPAVQSNNSYAFSRTGEGKRVTLHGPLSAVVGFLSRLPQPEK